jgi:hypothetical protein
MAQNETHVTPDNGRTRSSREIRAEIERTRAEMDETIDALDRKLTPREVAMEAWDRIKGSSSNGAHKLWQVAREHPGPAALLGVGAGWLVYDMTRGNGRDYEYDFDEEGIYEETLLVGDVGGREVVGYSGTLIVPGEGAEPEEHGRLASAKDKVKGVAGKVKDAAGHAKDRVGDAAGSAKDRLTGATGQARERASSAGYRAKGQARKLRGKARRGTRRARSSFQHTLEDRPLALGAAGLALGLLAGFVLPSTRREDELMGESRDQALREAKEAGREAVHKAKEVARTAAETARDEAKAHGLTPEGLAEDVREVARETKEAAKEEARRQNLTKDEAERKAGEIAGHAREAQRSGSPETGTGSAARPTPPPPSTPRP